MSDRRALAWTVAAGIAALGLRLIPWGQVFEGGEVVLGGTDPWYHLRQASQALHRPFLLPPGFDPYLHFPAGSGAPWPPLFDVLLAAVATLSGRTERAVALAAAWVPPVLGAVTVAPVWLLARRVLGRGAAAGAAALLAAALLAVSPAHASRSFLGVGDHHVAEAFLLPAILWLTLRAAEGGLGRALALGVALGAALLTWLGAPLLIAAAAGWLALQATRRSAAAARAGLVASLAGAALVLPFSAVSWHARHGSFSSHVLSWFQPAFLALLALGFALFAALARLRGRVSRVHLLAAGAAALVATAALFLTPLGRGLREGIAFARQATPEALLPFESMPLFWKDGRFSVAFPLLLLATPLIAAPAGAWLLARGRTAAGGLLLLSAGIDLLLSLFQSRFTHLLAVDLSILAAAAVAALARRRWLAGALAAACLVPSALSTLLVFRDLAPPPRELRAAMRWLRERSPEPLDPPAWGVAAHWDLGHFVLGIAHRPVLDSPFLHLSPFRDTAAIFLAESEADAEAALARGRVRYVVSIPFPTPDPQAYLRHFSVVLGRRLDDYVEVVRPGARGFDLGARDRLFRTLYFRLQYLPGTALAPGEPSPHQGVPPESFASEPYARLRLVHEEGGGTSLVRLFEVVPGARVQGRARSREEVRLSGVVTGGTTPFRWERSARADDQGLFTLVVPYSVACDPHAVGWREPPALAPRGGTPRPVAIRGADVAEGRVVRAGDL